VKGIGEDRNGFGFATVAFAFLAVLLAMAALPKVTAPNPERAIGDIDEAVIPSSDTIGETGDTITVR
jgi:hypothetical protein